MIDKYYFVKGGAERYLFELTDILEKKGHDVIPFSMKHERNFKTEYEKYFVDNIEFNINSTKAKIFNAGKIVGRVIYSFHAQKKLTELLQQVKPDIAHLHMIDHQISPSILVTLKKHHVPVLQTVHQYKIVCPNYRFYVEHKNQICEKCLDGHFYHALMERCQKNSIFASGLVAFESYVHQLLNVYENVQIFHVPSQFMGNKLRQGGVPGEKIKHLYYAINIDDYPYHPQSEDYFIYFGRLSGEKGLHTLLKAMQKLADNSIKLWIVGEGPLKNELEKFTAETGLTNVKFLGLKSGDALKQIVANAKFVVVPSEWYDNSPLVIYESFSLGKPVIGANLGGIPELVDDDLNGRLFGAGDTAELADQIRGLYHDTKRIQRYSENARHKAEQFFSWEYNYSKVLSLYKKLLN